MQSWTSGLLCQKPGKLRSLTDRARGAFSAPRFLTFLSCEDLTFQERRETDWLESLPTPWLERKDCLTESPTTTGGMGNCSSKKNYGSTAKRRERENRFWASKMFRSCPPDITLATAVGERCKPGPCWQAAGGLVRKYNRVCQILLAGLLQPCSAWIFIAHLYYMVWQSNFTYSRRNIIPTTE